VWKAKKAEFSFSLSIEGNFRTTSQFSQVLSTKQERKSWNSQSFLHRLMKFSNAIDSRRDERGNRYLQNPSVAASTRNHFISKCFFAIYWPKTLSLLEMAFNGLSHFTKKGSAFSILILCHFGKFPPSSTWLLYWKYAYFSHRDYCHYCKVSVNGVRW
jgi:hypothetical protein